MVRLPSSAFVGRSIETADRASTLTTERLVYGQRLDGKRVHESAILLCMLIGCFCHKLKKKIKKKIIKWKKISSQILSGLLVSESIYPRIPRKTVAANRPDGNRNRRRSIAAPIKYPFSLLWLYECGAVPQPQRQPSLSAHATRLVMRSRVEEGRDFPFDLMKRWMIYSVDRKVRQTPTLPLLVSPPFSPEVDNFLEVTASRPAIKYASPLWTHTYTHSQPASQSFSQQASQSASNNRLVGGERKQTRKPLSKGTVGCSRKMECIL